MKIETRQAKLVEVIRREEKASVESLAEILDTSRETIRRDLTHLAKEGKVQKVHGGAIMPRILGEGSFRQRLSDNVDAKMKIAHAAASLFVPEETLLIDTGSTTLFFAEEVSKLSNLTVITNSTPIARTFANADNDARVFLVGGEFNADNSQTTGAMVLEQIKTFRAHHAVLTIGALDSRTGAMDYSPEEAQIARVMIGQAAKVTVLADHSKFEGLASFEVCSLDKIDQIVTDKRPPNKICEAFENAGGNLIIAE